jgi:L-rhamnose isomerase
VENFGHQEKSRISNGNLNCDREGAKVSSNQLYDRDFYSWVEETKRAILNRDFENVAFSF